MINNFFFKKSLISPIKGYAISCSQGNDKVFSDKLLRLRELYNQISIKLDCAEEFQIGSEVNSIFIVLPRVSQLVLREH